MNKQVPSAGRLAAMAAFALSCFGLLLFLWVTFGGPVPLRPEGYRVEVSFSEAATLANEADVRISGVNVGKVKRKALDDGGTRTLAELEISEEYAPLPRDTKAILRQKTFLGETYVELTPGDPEAGAVADRGSLEVSNVEPTVEIDEVFAAFDKPTRRAFQEWVREVARATRGKQRPGEALNDALGNLTGVAVDGAAVLRALERQRGALRGVVRNTGRVFAAVNERRGALRQLISHSGEAFGEAAAHDQALAETFQLLPTFLDESKATLARLEDFSDRTRPLVRELGPTADALAPTLRGLRRLAPDLDALLRSLPPLAKASERGVPALGRVLRGARPVLAAAHPFLTELNPILSYFNFHQRTISGFLSNAAANLSGDFGTGERVQVQAAIIDGRSFETHLDKPSFWLRASAYLNPRQHQRAAPLGVIEAFDCGHVTRPDGSRGEQVNPDDQLDNSTPNKNARKSPPCLVQPESLWNDRRFVLPRSGEAPHVPAPRPREGKEPAVDPHPNDPAY